MRQFPQYRSLVTTEHPICHATSGKQVPRSAIDVIGVNSGLEGCCPSGAVARSSQPGFHLVFTLCFFPGHHESAGKRKSAFTGKTGIGLASASPAGSPGVSGELDRPRPTLARARAE